MKCEHCGTDNARRNRYCRNCGARIREFETATGSGADSFQEASAGPDGPEPAVVDQYLPGASLVLASIQGTSLDALVGGPIEDFAAALRQWEASARQFRAEDDKGRDGRSLEKPVSNGDVSKPVTGEIAAAHTQLVMGTDSAAREPVPPISGPSFLGLNREESSARYDYLLAEDDGSRPRSLWLVLLILPTAGSIGLWKRSQVRSFVGRSEVAPIAAKGRAAISPRKDQEEPVAVSEPQSVNAPDSTAGALPPGAVNSMVQNHAASTQQVPAAEAANPAPPTTESATERTTPQTQSTGTISPQTGNPAGEEAAVADPASKSAMSSNKAARQDPLILAGEEYLYGRGGRHNCQKALASFRTSADQGNPEAMSHLGAMYATGHCVARDRVVAYRYFARAVEAGSTNPWIDRNLTMLWREMGSEERHLVTSAQGR